MLTWRHSTIPIDHEVAEEEGYRFVVFGHSCGDGESRYMLSIWNGDENMPFGSHPTPDSAKQEAETQFALAGKEELIFQDVELNDRELIGKVRDRYLLKLAAEYLVTCHAVVFREGGPDRIIYALVDDRTYLVEDPMNDSLRYSGQPAKFWQRAHMANAYYPDTIER